MDPIRLIRTRRAELRRRLAVSHTFEELEESCVPSYLHRNLAAAGVAWLRLLTAAQMYRRFAPPGPVLDFGAATGEIFHLLERRPPYSFCELNDVLAQALVEMNPAATRLRLEALPPAAFSAVFALDSLEHNEDVAPLLDALGATLQPQGVLILSGPTENRLYRLGRRLAGFSGHYHKTNIHHLEELAAARLRLVHRTRVPFGAPLFSVSVWGRMDAAR
jgi:SAM-dependent methyltransferase